MATPPPQRRRRGPPVRLHDDLIAEILIRIPPDDPALFLRSSATCKALRGLLTDPAFLRRYRALHGTPPLLGFVFNDSAINDDDPDFARFVPTSSFRPRTPDHEDLYALDSRHGHVLFHTLLSYSRDGALIVWNPITDEQRELPFPEFEFTYWSAAVLCAARGCDHLDCNGGPFLVAFVGSTYEGIMCASTYSSETAAWSDTINVEDSDVFVDLMKPATLVGNTLYFTTMYSEERILEFDLDRRQLSSINPPVARLDSNVLMPAEGGGLGFARMHGSRLCLWAREAGPNGTVAWALRRFIEFNTLGRASLSFRPPDVVGYAEGLDAILLRSGAGVFAIELRSRRIRKVSDCVNMQTAIPYMSFYTPDNAAGSSSPP
ncbi:uncharacterized protein LOC133890978 [Phragmites australis]|uniref:uncharacterized protein LOC133890978 n=1 Tax=Phragmites australis TaxID=29695 RepID=UPI002D7A327E|nr:uncharacterized protein LOC133890978 [Phragmites australis]